MKVMSAFVCLVSVLIALSCEVVASPVYADPSDVYVVDPANCSVPNADRELQKGLCEAGGAEFSNWIRRSWESHDIAERKHAVEILERVWRLDATLGNGLPLKALDRDDFRAEVVEFLAQAVRGGLSNVRLWELQKFAVRFARLHRNDDRTSVAVTIIGYTDAVSQLQFVIDTIRTNAGQARSSAIYALASMCSDDAKAFLESIEADASNYSNRDRHFAAVALSGRKNGPLAGWCRRPQESLTDF